MPGKEAAWRCTVCGYVHRGDEPPDCCPVCGSPTEAFEPHTETPVATPAAVDRWRCLNCGYVHVGSGPPSECPVCGAPADRFEPITGAGEAVPESALPTEAVILGAGIAGVAAAEALRAAAPAADITLVSREPDLPYYRLNLTRYLAGEIGPDDLPIHPEAWYEERDLRLVRDAEAASFSTEDMVVNLRSGEMLPFERLILTVGAHPFMPPFPGAHRDGVTSLRTVADARRILDTIAPGMTCVCIGGGLLGLETAGALARRGVDVTLLEGHEWLMPRQLDRTAGNILRRTVEEVGITLRMTARTEELVGDERVRGVKLEDGDIVPADLVVVTTGIRTNSYLARQAGLAVDRGVVVDNHLVTSHPGVLAAGDVAEHWGTVYGVWGPSQYQGSIAGMNAAGAAAEFGGIPRSNTLKVLGLDLFSIGAVQPEDASYRVIAEETAGRYFRFVFRDTHLLGAILLGDTALTTRVKSAVENGTDFSDLLKHRPTAGDVLDHLASA